jgi:hypothetical protein
MGLHGRTEGHVGYHADVAYLDIHAAYWYKRPFKPHSALDVSTRGILWVGSGHSYVTLQHGYLTALLPPERAFKSLSC